MPDTARPPVLLDHHDLDSVPPGWKVQRGFDLPEVPWDLSDRKILCAGTVTDQDGATAAASALARGAGLSLRLAVEGPVRTSLLEDLHRMGEVLTGFTSTSGPQPDLDGESRRLIEALAAGATVTEVAQRLHISRRTANRRLAEVRRALGVDSTAEAVAHWSSRSEPDPGS